MQFNSYAPVNLPEGTQIHYPFTMTDGSTFRLVSNQFWADCAAPDNRCGNDVDFEIFDVATGQQLFDSLQVNTAYTLEQGKSYELVADLTMTDTTETNYSLNFAAWQGGQESVQPVMTCQSGPDTIVWSADQVMLNDGKNSTPLFNSQTVCGKTVTSDFYTFDEFQVGPNGSLEGTDFMLSNLKSIEDTSAIVYQVYAAKDPSSGQMNLVCTTSPASMNHPTVMATYLLQSCVASLTQN
jgi:hypothetical protein